MQVVIECLTYAIFENVKQCKLVFFFFFLVQMGLIKNKRDGEAGARQEGVGGTVSTEEPGPLVDTWSVTARCERC